MKYLAEYYKESNGRLLHPCGTDYTMLMNDITTNWGAERKAYIYKPYDCVYYEVIGYTNLYDRSTYEVIERVEVKEVNLK